MRHSTAVVHGAESAVFTSIGPGALQALAGSLAASSDGIGVWHIYADETTEAEGPNMQQLPGGEQEEFLKLTSAMGPSYSLHTPWALPEALRRGPNAVDHPHRAQPFFLLLPINTQPKLVEMNVGALPTDLRRSAPQSTTADTLRQRAPCWTPNGWS